MALTIYITAQSHWAKKLCEWWHTLADFMAEIHFTVSRPVPPTDRSATH